MTYFNDITIKDNYGFVVEATPMGELRTVSPFRLCGAQFGTEGQDIYFWLTSSLNTGSVCFCDNEVVMATNTTANASCSLESVRYSRYVGGYSNRFRTQVQVADTGEVGNLRRWGVFTPKDGAFFELSGTTLGIVTRSASFDSFTASSNWNYSISTPTLTNINAYEIYYTNGSVYFVINDVLKHKHSALLNPWCTTLSLPVRMENINTNDLNTNHILESRVATVARLGPSETESQYGYITTAATYVFKKSAGKLRKITLNKPTGTLLTIYDNKAGSGTVIGAIATPAQANPVTLFYDLPFNKGLTIVSTGTWDVTVIYE